MGGVGDEIVNQAGGGLMNTARQAAGPVMLGLGMYNLARNPSAGGLMSTAIGGVETAGNLIGNAAMSGAGSTLGPIGWGMVELSGRGPLTGTILPMIFGGKKAPDFTDFKDPNNYLVSTDNDYTYVYGKNSDGSQGKPFARYNKESDQWERATYELQQSQNEGLNESGTDLNSVFTGWSPGQVVKQDGKYWLGGQHLRSDYYNLQDLNKLITESPQVDFSKESLGGTSDDQVWTQRQNTGEGDSGGTYSYYAAPGSESDPYTDFLYNDETDMSGGA
jgi:hypothetical protein